MSTPHLPASRPAAPATTRVPQPAAAAIAESRADHMDLAEDAQRGRIQKLADILLIRAGFRMQDRVRHPDGGRCPVEVIMQHETEQRAEIQDETKRGSRKHHRLPRVIGWVPYLVLASDFALLLYFMAGITNVNWAAPISAALGFAAVLASMMTVLSYGFLAFTGHRMRAHKDHAGTVHLAALDGLTKAAFGTAIGLITVLALLMFIRMRTEVLDALGAQAGITALAIPLSLAVVSAVANYLVIAIHALNGSDQAARLDKLSAATRRPLAKAQRMRERAARHAGR